MSKDCQKEQKSTSQNSSWTDRIDEIHYNQLVDKAKDDFKCAIGKLYQRKGYKYIMDRFPTLADEQLPSDVKNALTNKNTFACASQDGVFFDTEILVKNLLDFYNNDEIKARLRLELPSVFNDNLYDNVFFNLYGVLYDVLKHEYGHIINGHVFLQTPNDKTKAQAMIYTNEIEANRTIPLSERCTFLRYTAVSDDNEPFTICKPCVTREGIYRTVLSMLDDKDKQSKQSGQSGTSGGGGQGNKNESNNNSSQNNNQQQGLPDVSDDVYHGKDTVKKDNKEQAMDTLCREIGIRPTDKIVRGDNASTILDDIENARKEKEIRKTLEHLKGCVKGELCKDKVATYSRQTRKHTEDGMLRKGIKNGKNKRPNIVVALDASGSMDRVAVQTASNAIKTVIDTIGRNSADIHICTFNSSILRKGTLNDWEQVVSSYRPGGGTSFNNVMCWAIQHNADAVLCVGDGQDTTSATYLMDKFGVSELPKWIDILITDNVSEMEHIKACYSVDEKNGLVQRETLWIGNKSNEIDKALGNV